MAKTQTLVWKVYTAALGAVTTVAAQKLVTTAWRAATGDEPPSPTDPDTPLKVAFSWVLASALGAAVVQLLTARYAARRAAEDGPDDLEAKRLKLKL